jgi:phosphonate transport system substrate-binding protein
MGGNVSDDDKGLFRPVVTRRAFVSGLAAVAVAAPTVVASAEPIRFGLTPVFLNNDLQLLSDLKAYLERITGSAVRLVTRRTYQEITALLVSGQLDAAWICGYPFIQYRDQLSLVAVPVWRGKTLYQSYMISPKGRSVNGVEELRGDVHAFSDPNSNSGYLVTRALLAERGTNPDQFFRRSFYTYGHRNVIRAVSSRLAQSGSVDGYVLEVLREVEPELADGVEIMHRSEWLGFPPVACPKQVRGTERLRRFGNALLTMSKDEQGARVLNTLRLDGFREEHASHFDSIAAKVDLIRKVG